MAGESTEIEQQDLVAIHAAAGPEVVEALRLRCFEIDGALVSVAGALPASAIVLNRAVGVGSRGDPAQVVPEICTAYREAGVERFFVNVEENADGPATRSAMAVHGLLPARGWQRFVRGTEPVAEVSTDLTVREVGPESGPAFAEIVADAFDLGRAAVPWLEALPGHGGWHVLMAFDGEAAAAAGGIFIRGDQAYTDLGATAPAYRRQGAQSALLAARLRLALACGCRRIFTCTGEAVPGDPQHSYSNIRRAGFAESSVWRNYAPLNREPQRG